jgi:5-methylcytosine-specific restriction endonuclease McrA
MNYDALIAKAVGKALSRPAVTKPIDVPVAYLGSSDMDAKILRQVLRAKQAFRCGICGLYVSPPDGNLDHVKPRKWGGLDDDNLMFAHRLCNQQKGHRMPTGCERIWLAVANA